MPPPAVVHIGPHKTGTTSIQRALAVLRPELATLEFDLPGDTLSDDAGTAALNQSALAWMGCEQHPWHGWPIPAGRLEQLREWLRSADGVPVLSGEEWSRFDDARIAALAELLSSAAAQSGWSAAPVCVIGVRAYDELSRSLWTQLVFAGVEQRSLAEFQRHFLHELTNATALPDSPRAAPELAQLRLPVLANAWGRHFVVHYLRVPDAGATDAALLAGFLNQLDLAADTAAALVTLALARGAVLRANRQPAADVVGALLAVNRAHGTSNPSAWAQERAAARNLPAQRKLPTPQDHMPDEHVEAELRALFDQDLVTLQIQSAP